MSKGFQSVRSLAAMLVALPVAATAQEWVPGAELIGQSVVVETNGISNVVHFDAGGSARIVSPAGRSFAASWTATDGNLCLVSAGTSECWPYREAFRAGRKVSLTSDCRSVSSWLPNGTNPPPVKEAMQERG